MILVVGSTGRVGRMITRALLQQTEPVRILVRSSSDHRAFAAAGAEVAFGDLKDRASLDAALRDVDIVITTASAGERGGADTPQSVDLEGNRSLIDAARSAGVAQFIFVSALTATVDHPLLLPRAKALTEEYLRASGMPFTILAANGIMDVNFPLVIGGPLAAGRPVTLVGAASRRHTFVAAQDIAAYATAVVRHPAAQDQRVPVCGPEAVTWRDVVAVYARVLGRDLPVEFIRPGELLPDVPAGLSEFLSGLLAALESFDTDIDTTATARTFGVQRTSVEAYVRGSLAHAPAQPPAT